MIVSDMLGRVFGQSKKVVIGRAAGYSSLVGIVAAAIFAPSGVLDKISELKDKLHEQDMKIARLEWTVRAQTKVMDTFVRSVSHAGKHGASPKTPVFVRDIYTEAEAADNFDIMQGMKEAWNNVATQMGAHSVGAVSTNDKLR